MIFWIISLLTLNYILFENTFQKKLVKYVETR